MNLELRHQTTEQGVVTLWLASPTRSVVVLDKWLIAQIHLFFDQLDPQPTPHGFVLLSESDRVFIAGADLAEIDSLDDPSLQAYLEDAAHAFGRISALPCPSVAGINGAALGGGLEIAMHCDELIGYVPGADTKPYRVGLPEASLGLCPGWGGTQMLPVRIDPAKAIELTATGFTPKVGEMAEAGLFAATVNSTADLHEACLNWVDTAQDRIGRPRPRSIDSTNAASVRAGLESVSDSLPDAQSALAVAAAVQTGLDQGWEAAIAHERQLLTNLRKTDAARKKLEAFFAGAR